MKQLYHGNSMEDFLKIKSILDKNGINYETENKLESGAGNMLMNMLAFGRPAVGRGEEHRQVYNIYVDDSDYTKAKDVIGYIR